MSRAVPSCIHFLGGWGAGMIAGTIAALPASFVCSDETIFMSRLLESVGFLFWGFISAIMPSFWGGIVASFIDLIVPRPRVAGLVGAVLGEVVGMVLSGWMPHVLCFLMIFAGGVAGLVAGSGFAKNPGISRQFWVTNLVASGFMLVLIVWRIRSG